MILSLRTLIILVVSCFTLNLTAQNNLNKANKKYELSDFKEAANLYNKFIEDNANNVEALSKLADCYYHLNQFTEAKERFEKAIKITGFQPQYMLSYAHTLMGLGEYDNAKNWFTLYGEAYPQIGQHFAKACDLAKQRTVESPIYQIENTNLSSFRSDFSTAFFGDVVVMSSFYNRIANESAENAQKNILFLSSLDEKNNPQKASYLFNSNLNKYYSVGPVSFSKDGKWVAYTKNNFRDGIRQISSSGLEMTLYLAEVSPDGQWKNEKAFPFNGTGYSTAYPSFSPDGNTLYFASDRPDGLGGFDIYKSQKTEEGWSFPINLGAPINSSGDEITPFFDDQKLYFASNWHEGFGGYDIFRAEKEGGNWSKLFHLGTNVNSSRDDYGFIFDESRNLGFLTSNRPDGKGMEDIYKVSKSLFNEKYLITVIDEASKLPLSGVNIDFTHCGQKIVQTNAKGQYAFQKEGAFNCEAILTKEGYAKGYAKIQSRGLDALNQMEILLQSVVDKETFVGRVIQTADAQPLSDIYVTAYNNGNGQSTQVQTDKQGYYSLLLELNQGYTVKFSGVGYSESQRVINTGNGEDKSILDLTSLLASSTTIPTSSENGAGSNPLPPVITSVPDTTPNTETSTGTNTSSSSDNNLTSGYSIQIAAVPSNAQIKGSRYTKAENIGNLYIKNDGKYQRVRIGVYASKSEANRVQEKLAAAGYTKAYVVNESNKNETSTVSTGTQVPSSPSSATSTNNYYVRLGAFGNIQNFDDRGLRQYGDFVDYQKGNLTIRLINTGPKVGRARVVREKAKEKGFNGAYIVVKENGNFVKY